MKRKMMDWRQVVQVADGLPTQGAVEAFWDELVVLSDPRRDYVPVRAVRMALEAARGVKETVAKAEGGQAVLEYIAVIGLIALVFVTNALLRVILERVVGEIELGENAHIIATANPPEMVGGFPISPALSNRFGHLHVEVTAQFIRDWCDQFPTYWGSEPTLAVDPNEWRLARALVATFIRSRPQLLFKHMEGELAFPSPRSWDFVSRVLAAADGFDFQAVAGLIGEPAATEFEAWFNEMDLPSPEEILANPAIVLRLERTDQKFAAITATVALVCGLPPKEAAKHWMAAQSAVNLLAENGDIDIAMPSAVRLAEYYFKRGLGILPGISLAERLIAPIRETGL